MVGCVCVLFAYELFAVLVNRGYKGFHGVNDLMILGYKVMIMFIESISL